MGAVAVNLVPGEKPADIYSEIAARLVLLASSLIFLITAVICIKGALAC
jgi:hypothetical protein